MVICHSDPSRRKEKNLEEIADILFISVKTVVGHRTRIMEKLDIHSRTDLVKYAIRKGLITLDA